MKKAVVCTKNKVDQSPLSPDLSGTLMNGYVAPLRCSLSFIRAVQQESCRFTPACHHPFLDHLPIARVYISKVFTFIQSIAVWL
jgi:hypothetical protein